MANLNVQAWGPAGAAVTYAVAAVGGDVGTSRPGLAVAIKNVHATLGRSFKVEAVGKCDRRRLHDLGPITVAPTPAGGQPLLVPIGWDGARFSLVSLTYTTGHAADLRVALVELASLRGIGEAVASPPALGSTPGTVVRVGQGQSDDLVFEPADADGMRCENGDGETAVVVRNNSAFDKVVTVRALAPCQQGFFDHYSVTVEGNDARQLPRMATHIYGTTLAIVYADPVDLEFAAIRLSRAEEA